MSKGGCSVKYCCTEQQRKGSCYHEFQRGKFKDTFWHEDSLLLHDDILYQLSLGEFFRNIIPSYCDYGETEITRA